MCLIFALQRAKERKNHRVKPDCDKIEGINFKQM